MMNFVIASVGQTAAPDAFAVNVKLVDALAQVRGFSAVISCLFLLPAPFGEFGAEAHHVVATAVGHEVGRAVVGDRGERLSGGQRQRVAIGRALVRNPAVYLMDEPLSNLDAKLRVQTRTQIAALQRQLGVTTVYVTHDQIEAMTMGDRVAVMNNGILQQCAPPRELFTKPVNEFVAGFIGSPAMNLLPSTTDGTDATYGSLRVTLTPEQLEALTSAAVTVGIRPNDFEIRAGGGLNATVEFVEELGSEAFLYCSADGTDKEIVARTDGLGLLQSGDNVSLVPRTAGVHLFDTRSGARLPA